MKTGVRVHPWYKGTHEWRVKGVAELKKPIGYDDSVQGKVSYDPKIMLLESERIGEVLWFPYWIATSKTGGKMKWGQRPPILEESVLMELIKASVRQGFLSRGFLEDLERELKLALRSQ